MHCSQRLLIVLLFVFLTGSSLAQPNLLGILHADSANVLFGQYLIPLPDQTGDGTSELLVANGYFSTYLYFGGQSFDTTVDVRFDSTNTLGSDVGDLNGDGRSDFVILGRSPYGWKQNLYYGGSALDTARDAWFGIDSVPPCLFPTRTTDLDADGYDELVVASCDGRYVQIFDLGLEYDSLPDLFLRDLVQPPIKSGNWARQIAVGDFNGDGQQDLVVAQTPQSLSGLNGRLHFFWGGPAFDSVPDFTIIRQGANADDYDLFGTVMTCPGDLNADGFDDLFVASAGFDDTSWVYYGGLGIDTIPDVVIPLYIKHACPAGDINRDGYDDLLASYNVSFSGDGRVYVFYGGPAFDGQYDLRIANWDIDGYQTGFGMAIAGLGDYNGDGVDDFAFSAMDALSKGLVYIYSGTGDPTDVPYHYESTLPDAFLLRQNYPNPFNASTEIAFDLPVRSEVTLRVFNVTGEAVTTLLQQTFSAGSYRVAWDGCNGFGELVASGVYFYRLEAGGVVQAKKMLLLK